MENSYTWRRQLMWGLLLIGFGTAALLDRLHLFELDNLWHYWPLALVVIGINRMIGYPTPRAFSSGLWTVFIGFWLFACLSDAFAMTFFNSWPFLIIAWGVQIILAPFIEARFAANLEHHHEK